MTDPQISQRLASLSPAQRVLLEQRLESRPTATERRRRGLIDFQKREDLPLIFWAPSVGEIDRYNECTNIARALKDECSFCAFEPAPDLDDVCSLAQHCVGLMRERQPRGPYAIIGYCYCAHIAHEMALLLQAKGEEVGLLVVIDGSARDFYQTLRQKYFWIVEGFRGSWREVVSRIKPAISWRLARLFGRPVVEKTAEEDPHSLPHAHAVGRHRPGKFKGRLILFASTEFLSTSHSPTFGWGALARTVETYTVPVPHWQMTRENGADLIAQRLRPYLGREEATR